MVPSIERKKHFSAKEKKRKDLYLQICVDWREAMTQAIKKEIEKGTLDSNAKYSTTRGKDLFISSTHLLIVSVSFDAHATVEPRYLQLGFYLEQLAISNRFPFPLVYL